MKWLALWLAGIAVLTALIAVLGGFERSTLIALAIVFVIAAAVGFVLLRRKSP